MIEQAVGKAVESVGARHSKECVCRGTGKVLDMETGPRISMRACRAVKWTATMRVQYEVTVAVYAEEAKDAGEKFRSGDWDGTVIGGVKNWGEPTKVQQSA